MVGRVIPYSEAAFTSYGEEEAEERRKNEECRKKEESSLFELGCVNAVAAANLQTSLGEEERKDRVKDTLRTKKKEEISFFEKYKNLQL